MIFSDEEIFAGTLLILEAMRSPGYVAGSAGWSINKNGSAEFNNIVIRNGTVVSGTAFYYAPNPGAGNLIASIAATAGTDTYGNAYLQGITSYAPANGSYASLNETGIPAESTNAGLVMHPPNAVTIPSAVFAPGGVVTFTSEFQNSLPGVLATSPFISNDPGSYVASISLTPATSSGPDASLIQINADQTQVIGGMLVAGNLNGVGTFNLSNGTLGAASISGSDIVQGTQEDTKATLTDTGGGSTLLYNTTTTVQTFTSSGTFTPPAGITSLKVECWGAGGGGQGGSGAGGGGGEYAAEAALAVTPLTAYTVTVGAGGAGGPSGAGGPGHDGTASTFPGNTVTVRANGGKGSNSSTTAGGSGSTNSTHFTGGGSHANTTGLSTGGAGGGGSAGSGGSGHNGASNSGTTGGAGGTAVSGGGSGGAGGAGTGTAGTAGAAGGAPGGGGGTGGAGSSSSSAGGTGARGQVKVTYTNTQNLVGSLSPVAGTDALGNAFKATNNENAVTYTPTMTGAGTAAFSTRTGWFMRFGDMIFFDAYFVTSTVGTGTATIAITTPTAVDRSAQQTITGHIAGTAGVNGTVAALAFTSGTGTTLDRIRTNVGGNITGADLANGASAGAAINIQGWYREA